MSDGSFLWAGKGAVDAISSTLGSSCLLVYVWLCYYANYQDQECFPSITRLVEKTRMGRRKVNRSLKALERAGFVGVRRRPGFANQYQILRCDARPVDKLVASLMTRVQMDTGGHARTDTAPVSG